MERQLMFDVHPSERTLEDYCFKRLPESAEEVLEDHLLVCANCQEALEELDDYVRLMKAGLAEFKASETLSPSPRWAGRIWGHVYTAAAMPGPRVATGLAVLCALVAVSWKIAPGNSGTPALSAPVRLAAFRGSVDSAVNRAPARRPLDLAIDVTDLPVSDTYLVEVVNATGQHVWDATVPATNGKLAARVPKGLSPGVYWVRLYAGPGKLLREFGLRLA